MKTSAHRSCWLVILGILISAAPGVARAQEDFERSVDTVRQLLESQQYADALERLGRLKPLVRNATQKSLVALYEGLILSNMGRRTQDRASAAFRAALLQDPQTSLPVKVAPRLERSFEEVRARVLKELAERPASARDALAPAVLAAPVEVSAPSLVETGRGPAGAPAELDAADRLRLVTKWPVLAASATAGYAPRTETFRQKARRPQVWVPALTGGVLLVSGGIFWGMALHEQSQLRNEDLSDGTMEDSKAAAARGKRYQTWGGGLAGAGGVALGVATVLYVLQVPKTPVSVGLDATGTSAFLQGTWP
jgi:hypothetical protein